jgi:hypothetical protein
MPGKTQALAFPNGRPAEYLPLANEPEFVASKHLCLEAPKFSRALQDLGYTSEDISNCESSFAYCSAFRILSDEGLALMSEVCERIYDNRNSSTGTGANRLGSYARGAGYRSQFIKDFCDSPELAEHLSSIANVQLARHSVPAVACGINYAPDDISKAIDTWHVDSVSFDIVMMLSDPATFSGGEFQIFDGTVREGQQLLGISGEEGVANLEGMESSQAADRQLPQERIITVPFPAAGYGFLQQGNMIFHRACRLLEKAKRMTMIPSFEVMPISAHDATNSINMSGWADPSIRPELARHEIWRATARLEKLLADVSLDDDDQKLAHGINSALASLIEFKTNLEDNHQ